MSSNEEKLVIDFIPKEVQHSEFDWADLSTQANDRVGKARCLKNGDSITIFSINIYPDWKSHGFGRQFVEYCKANFKMVIADRVRPTAQGFWDKMGFKEESECNWVFRR